MAPTLQSDTRQTNSRRVSKHLTERKRRARMNDSLLQLKTMIYPAVKNDVMQNSKMEKADILDMTLRYVKDVQQKARTGQEPTVDQYHAGYSECLSQVSQYLTSCDNFCLETRRRLLTHLADKCLVNDKVSERVPTVTRQQSLPSPLELQQLSPKQCRSTTLSIPPPGVVYFLPAQSVQQVHHVTSPCSIVTSPTRGVPTTCERVSSPVQISILPTPPHSPVSDKMMPPSPVRFHQLPKKRLSVPLFQSCVAAVSSTSSSANQEEDMWRPW